MSLAASQRAATTPDEQVLADERQSVTWAALDSALNRAAHALLAMDLGAERRVAVFAENSVETVMAHLAAIHVGVSTVPVNFHLTVDELAYILQDAHASALFVGPETYAVGVKAAAEAGVLPVIGWRCEGEAAVLPWESWIEAGADQEPPSDMAPRPYLHYTSGTTGRPKGTETPPAMFAGGASVAEHFERLRSNPMAAAGGTALVVSPLYHTGPLGNVRAVAAGQALAILGRFDAEKVLAAIEQSHVTTTLMVPTHFQRLLALPEEVRRRFDVSSVKLIVHTGAACPVEVKRAMIEWFGPVLFEAYGATEAGTTNVITSPEWIEHPGSVGRTLPPFELLIVSENGEPLPAGEVGHIYFNDTTGRGVIYHNDAEKSASVHLRPGVFTLGEIGYVDPDGYLYITDRSSDMVVSGGVNIYPAETEQVLIEHQGVADVAVIGVPNDEMGEELKALVVLVDGGTEPSPEDLDAFVRARLAGFKCPRSYEFMPDIGRTSMGKVNKRKLRAPYWPTDRTIG